VLSACEKNIEVDLPQYAPKLVVEGWIEQGKYPTVILTQSAAYFDEVDSAALRNLIASTAKVTVSDGEQQEVLTLRRRKNYFPEFIYQGTSLKGEVGNTYQLTISLRDEIYTATTTIPSPVAFDSLWFEPLPDSDSLQFLWAQLSDDANQQNYYRIFTQRKTLDSAYIPVYLSALGDRYFNGQSFSFSLLRGASSLTNRTDDLYFKTGDTVTVKLGAVDKAHFDYWRTLERELYASGNPLAASGNAVLSNIQGNALGVWGGYGATFQRVIAP
jgi:hypothetical protein